MASRDNEIFVDVPPESAEEFDTEGHRLATNDNDVIVGATSTGRPRRQRRDGPARCSSPVADHGSPRTGRRPRGCRHVGGRTREICPRRSAWPAGARPRRTGRGRQPHRDALCARALRPLGTAQRAPRAVSRGGADVPERPRQRIRRVRAREPGGRGAPQRPRDDLQVRGPVRRGRRGLRTSADDPRGAARRRSRGPGRAVPQPRRAGPCARRLRGGRTARQAGDRDPITRRLASAPLCDAARSKRPRPILFGLRRIDEAETSLRISWAISRQRWGSITPRWPSP